jgi:hypothetical protein
MTRSSEATSGGATPFKYCSLVVSAAVCGDTHGLKIAVSVPDDVFERAERAGKLSRAKLDLAGIDVVLGRA